MPPAAQSQCERQMRWNPLHMRYTLTPLMYASGAALRRQVASRRKSGVPERRSMRWERTAMRSSRLLLAGSVLILVGCAIPWTPASNAAREASPRSDAGATVGATSSPQDREPLSMLQNRLKQARTKIEDQFRANPDKYKLPNPHVPFCFKPPFPLLAPTDLAAMTPTLSWSLR